MKKSRPKLSNRSKIAIFSVISLLIIIVFLIIFLAERTERERMEAAGQMRLSSIAGRVDNNLYRSECLLDSIAVQIEQIIASKENAEEKLRAYFSDETIEDIKNRSDGDCFSAYAAYNDTLYINGFIPDDNFVLEGRTWYVDAKKRMGQINITEPYIDASTGKMCYSISKLLSDQKTVVGLDFKLDSVQSFIEEMNQEGSYLSMIINENGMIVGHSQPEYVGMDYRKLPEIFELVNKVFTLYGNSFSCRIEDNKYNVFSDKTSSNWYPIVCVKRGGSDSFLSGNTRFLLAALLIFSAIIIIVLLLVCFEEARTANILKYKNQFIRQTVNELKSKLQRMKSPTDTDTDVSVQVDHLLSDCLAEAENEHLIKMPVKLGSQKQRKQNFNYRIRIILITIILIITGIFAFVFNTIGQKDLSFLKLEKETSTYQSQVREWALTNKAILNVISDSIRAQSGFEKDYEKAVDYLNRIVSNYSDISVAYICNPAWEHTVIMNNGWQPDASWHVEERQWYIDTMISRDNFNVATPYLDEQTGQYCTTLSKIVYDDKGNFIGVLGIDYYLDKLVTILGESYTDDGYAFITDINGNIINHPNKEYEMTPSSFVNAADICYRDALSQIGTSEAYFTDYDGERKGCLALKEEITGFNVIVVRNVNYILGNIFYSDGIYLVLFILCIIIVNAIMRSLTHWQEKVNEDLKVAAEHAINADKAKDRFLANMSHEIRTPINAVLGMNEMILRESTESSIKEYATNIQSAGRTLLSLINDILDLSKIESGKMEIVPVEYDVSSLVNDIVNMIKIRAQKKGLDFIPEIDKKIPSVLFGDDVRIRQVITNLLTNAVKYTEKGYVQFSMRVIELKDHLVSLEVSVTDTGMGIKEEDMDKLFTSFQRLDQEKNRSIEGTGLGLTIVSRLISMMDSEMNVSSVYGVGSTFSFIIKQKVVNADPLGDYEQRFRATLATEATKNHEKTAPEARVLVVDDNETNLLVAKNLLKKTKVQIETVQSGQACIDCLRNGLYDVVFLDHMMPQMDGIETLRRIKEEQLGIGTVFVALTANAIHGAKKTYLDAGFDDYLSKPFSGHDIEKCLFSHLRDELICHGKEIKEEKEGTPDAVNNVGSSFDIPKALEALNNDEACYLDAVDDFCDNNRCNDLALDLSIKDYKSYRINLERVANDAQAIGLYELSDDAVKLISAVDSSNYNMLAQNHEAFLTKYRTALEKVEAVTKAFFLQRR